MKLSLYNNDPVCRSLVCCNKHVVLRMVVNMILRVTYSVVSFKQSELDESLDYLSK